MEIFQFEFAASAANSNILLTQFEQLQRVFQELEAFTHSGCWQLDESKGIINLSAGAANVLGLDQEERSIILEELLLLCHDQSRLELKKFLEGDNSAEKNTIFVMLKDSHEFITYVALTNFISYNGNSKNIKQGMIRNYKFE